MVDGMAGGATGPTWAGGRVRRSVGGRHQRVVVRVTEEERDELRRRASLAGVSPPRYLLEQGVLAGEITVAERRRRVADFSRLQGQLVRATSELTRLVAVSGSGHPVPGANAVVADLNRLRADLADTLDRLTDGLGGFGR